MFSSVFNAKNVGLALKWGVMYTGMTIGWALLGKLLGMHDARIRFNLFFNSAVLLPSLLVYILAVREMNAMTPMKYGERLLSGLLLTAFVTALGPLNPVALAVFISPHFFENAVRYAIDSDLMTDAEARQQFNLTTFIVQGFVGGPIFGLVLSLIAALVSRSRSPSSTLSQGAVAK